MFSFVIKKTFFDMWDNLLVVFLVNVGLVLLLGLIVLPSNFELSGVLVALTILAGIVLLNLYIGAVARLTMDISDYKKPGFRDFFGYFRETWKQSLSFPLIISLMLWLVPVVLQYYFSFSSIILNLLGAVVFWTWAVILPASLYFYPVGQRLKKKNFKAFRTCFVLLFDNPGFTIAMTLGLLLVLVLSVLGLFMLPGIATVMLWLQVCFKLRLYKYDYLEEHPDANRRKIPWAELLMTDKEKVGKRTFRGMIFPWKE